MEWVNPLNSSINFKVITNSLPMKGNLVYEYNPFRNYRLLDNKYYYRENYYTLEELQDLFGISISGNSWSGVPSNETDPLLFEKGLLIDFVTDELNFSLDHPVHIVPQYSYDGSVNLIINDGINIPRLINSRFSATGKNTYEIIDRKGNNDTNIYDLGDLFDIDTSLYKRVVKIPEINFIKVQAGGNLKIGNYHFYFKLADADGNETDFIGESGLVSIFIGYGASSHTGTKNLNSFKSVRFTITNIDSSYNYVYVYYSRDTAELNDNYVTLYAKIEQRFSVSNNQECDILVTGFEDVTELAPQDINLSYNIVDAVTTSAECLNMLFLANVHKPDIPYQELSDLSLRFLPYIKEETYRFDIDLNYSITSGSNGYYDPKFIYNHTGYWNKEIYRLGVVYILPNGELTPVFNIRGRENIKPFLEDHLSSSGISYIDENGNRISEFNPGSLKFWDGLFTYYNHYKKQNNDIVLKIAINYDELTNYIKANDDSIRASNYDASYENVKGVVSLDSELDTNIIYGFDIRTDPLTIVRLKGLVSGYFFVRLRRIPTILALGITIGTDNYGHVPTIPTAGGILTDLKDSLSYTHVETDDITGVNYISEGFLSRYSFGIKKKKSGIFGAIGGVLKAAALVGVAVASVTAAAFAFPAALPVLGAIAVPVGESLVAGIVATSVVTGAAAAGTVGVLSSVIGVGQLTAHAILRSLHEQVRVNGRETEIPPGYKKVENDESRKLHNTFIDRIIIKDLSSNTVSALLCPDYEVNQEHFNQIFTGGYHTLRPTITLGVNILTDLSLNHFTNDNNHFYIPAYYDSEEIASYDCKVIAVPDSIKIVGIDDNKFRSRAGEAEEAFRYECIGNDYKSDYSKYNTDEDSETLSNKRINTDIVRGDFGPYLGITDFPNLPATTVDILIPEYSEAFIDEYFKIRMNDASSFYAISDRISFLNTDKYLETSLSIMLQDLDRSCGYKWELYRGDCYICQFTHRLNRNFQDPTVPYNDEIVDENTWKDNYDPDNVEKYEEINLGDVNAVPLGMWVTFRIRSSNNLNIRTIDESHVDEVAMSGHARGYFPYHPMSTEGSYKIPESALYNKGFSKSVSDRWNFELPDVPHIKNWFGTRIMYSDIHINDAYKNGYRVFQGTHYRDYTRAYGEIIKLINLNSNLLVVFEHGVAIIRVNGQANASNVSTNYITTNNVLDSDPIVISDMFGSQWAESVLKVPGKTGDSAQYVYGVDTVAKKIWRTDGNSLICISDFRVQEFLNNNISLGERELTPKIGIRNVKTVYNAYKRDVLFTFYDNTYGFEEKVWNLCWNELLLKFITFYSWVPSYMENINNIPFSFNRDTSKWIAKLGTSHADNSFADGITLSNVITDSGDREYQFTYINKQGEEKISRGTIPSGFIGALFLSNRVLPVDSMDYEITFSLLRDLYGNYEMFEILPIGTLTYPNDAMYAGKTRQLYGLKFKSGYNSSNLYSELYYRNKAGNYHSDYDTNKIGGDGIIYTNYPIFKDIAGKRPTLPRDLMIRPDKIVTLLNIKASISIRDNQPANMLDAFYNQRAGYSSNSSLVDAGYYESVVAVIPKWNMQFLSTDFWKHGQAGLIDIADDILPTYWYGKQHPFEFECVVVNDPSIHKIFTNLEIVANKAKPESFHYEIIGECFDFAKDKVNMYFRQEALKALWLYNGADISYNRNFLKIQPKQLPKSADLPHKYYSRLDIINEIEDCYVHITYPENADYRHLSGGEIVYYPTRQEYRIWNHAMAVSLDDLSLDNARSIIAANCKYLEDRWKVTINPILVCYKNEYKREPISKDDPSPKYPNEILILDKNSMWINAKNSSLKLPLLPIYNSPIPDDIKEKEDIEFPGDNPEHPEWGEDNALYNLYDLSNYGDEKEKDEERRWRPLDITNWLDDVNIYKYNFGPAQNRKEIDVKDKFVKIRVRYSGKELAVIDFLSVIYQISYS